MFRFRFLTRVVTRFLSDEPCEPVRPPPRVSSSQSEFYQDVQMKIPFAKALLAILAVATLSSVTFAHDDAKVRDRMKPYRGPGWREVDGKPIDGSVAGAFDSNGVQLRSWLPLADLSPAATSGNSCWGYVAPNGAEFAVIGLSSGTAFVDITNPGAATLKAFITGPTSLWRDVFLMCRWYCTDAATGRQQLC